MNYRLLFMFLCLVFYKSQLANSRLLIDQSTPEAGSVQVFSEHLVDLNQVEFNVTFNYADSPFWLAIGFNDQTQPKMFGTLVIFIKFNKNILEWYNALIEDYVSPKRELSSSVILINQNINNGIVTLVLRRDVSFRSTQDLNVVNNLTNCYRLAITSGTLLDTTPLPHSSIPVFTNKCDVIADKVSAVTSAPTLPNINYNLNISFNMAFTAALKNVNSQDYFEFKFKFKRFITDSLKADGIKLSTLDIVSLSSGSVVTIAKMSIIAQDSPNLDNRIYELLLYGDDTFLTVFKNRVFVTREVKIESTKVPTDTTTSKSEIVPTDTATSTISANISVEYYHVEISVDLTFSEALNNSASNEYSDFVNKLMNYMKDGFNKIDKKDAFQSMKVVNLRSGSIIASTIIGITPQSDATSQDVIFKAVAYGDKTILPVKSAKILSNNATTPVAPTKKPEESSSVSAVAIAVPIVCAVFLIIVIIIAFCIFRRRKRARESYILQTAANRTRAFDPVRTSEIPSIPPRFDANKTDDLDKKSESNISMIKFKPLNDPPPKLSSLSETSPRPVLSSPQNDPDLPKYSTDFYSSMENLRNYDRPSNSNDVNKKKIENDKDKFELVDLGSKDKSPALSFNYDSTDIDDANPNVSSMIKRTNNPLFQSKDF